MPLKNYSLIKGKASNLAIDEDDSPHLEIRIEAAGVSYRVALNVRSSVPPNDLLYRKQDPFFHPLLDEFSALPEGKLNIGQSFSKLALDYVRGNFVQREAMKIAPFQRLGPDNDLRDYLEPIIRQGMADQRTTFYAFGEAWGPEEGEVDKYFGFVPANGIHDIHMNQGSPGRFKVTNSPNQDGALFIHFGAADRWAAIFLAFQSQDWHTDIHTGHPMKTRVIEPRNIDPLKPGIAIVAALINPAGEDDGQESVTLLNRTDVEQNLKGWRLMDRDERIQPLHGRVGAGDTIRIHLSAGPDNPHLRNKGGVIKLVTPDGVIAHAIGYKKHEAAREGWTTIF
ncbi:DUF2278 family protein [Kiloniella antarctica]|uniref:DUF2278 family protein n=1 Tax=Kiloniella antarctica TaxID=1550907 RepID=A0ABW5BJ92_9PROT